MKAAPWGRLLFGRVQALRNARTRTIFTGPDELYADYAIFAPLSLSTAT
jgi:hypothetical protein